MFISIASLVQLAAACIGIVGSLFFAIGVMRQSIESMARLSSSYWDSNPHMPEALAAQKADYLFGGGLIVIAFVVQLVSFFVSSTPFALTDPQARLARWALPVVIVFVAILFFSLRVAAASLAKHYKRQIEIWLNNDSATISPTFNTQP